MPRAITTTKNGSLRGPSNARILGLLAGALAALAWFAGGGGRGDPALPAESLSLLAEIYSGIESASYQAIANPVLNAALDSYGRAEELYDVSEWHEAFAAYFDGASRNLLDDAIFFDLDDPGRKRLSIGEGIDNARARSIREAAIGPAVEAAGRLAWLGLGGEDGSAPLLCAARLVKRLPDGGAIGVLVLLPEARRIASAFALALTDSADAPAPARLARESPFAFLSGVDGSVLAGSSPGGVGMSLEAAFPGSGRILAQESLGILRGSAELRVEGRRRTSSFAKVPGTEWTLVASAPARGDSLLAVLRWVLLPLAALAMAFALKGAMTAGTAASAATVMAAAAGAPLPYPGSPTPSASSESLAAGEDSGGAPAWFRELAPRERSIVLLLAAGKSNKEIAAELGLAEQTVKNRLRPVYERLGVRDRVSAALIVSRARLRDEGGPPPSP